MGAKSTEPLVRAVALWGLVAALATSARAAPAPAPLLQAVRARAAVAYRGEQIVVAWNAATRADGSLGEVTAFLKFEIMPVGWRRGAVLPSGLHLTPREPVRAASAADIIRVLGGPPAGVAVPAGFHKTGEYLTGDGPVVQTIYSD